MRPYVVFRYYSGQAWTEGRIGAAGLPSLENASDTTAFDVRLSELVIEGIRYHFRAVRPLNPREVLPLDPFVAPPAASLTTAISRTVVKRVLAGQPPVTSWPLQITYRDRAGARFITCCEIRVTGLPLEVTAVVVPSFDDDRAPANDPA